MQPRITLDIQSRRAFADDHAFAGAGAYEILEGRARIAYHPQDPSLKAVPDIALAERDAQGMVHVATDLWILKPVDLAKGNGALLFELVNRGNKRCLQFFNDAPHTNTPTTLTDAGNGFLMREGYTVVCAGWQGDVLPGDGRLVLDLPVAKESDGPVREIIRAEFVIDEANLHSLPLSGKYSTRSYPAASLDKSKARLIRRRYPWEPAEEVPTQAWHFARIERDPKVPKPGDSGGGEAGIIPSNSHLYLPGGFERGWIYELTYEAEAPLVLGLGYSAIRDLVGHFRYDETEANPLRQGGPNLRSYYGWGRSQSGRSMREYLYRGFNGTGDGRKAFDGVLAHIAGAGRLPINRFSNLVIAASKQFEDQLNPSDLFPFSYARSKDHLTGREDAILRHPQTDPYVFHSHASTEYWNRRASLVHTDTQGNDLAQPASVRVYHWASSQHWADPLLSAPSRGICANYHNTTGTSALFRSLLTAMHRWVADGVEPPPSQVPRRDDGTLVSFAEWKTQFPGIPGVALPKCPNTLTLVDYGAAFEAGGAIAEPAVVKDGADYAVLLPAVDADGNELAGIRMPTVQAPLGSFTGWNLRPRGYGAGTLHDFSGSYIPFAETENERQATSDPRRAILERYPTKTAYVDAISAACEALIADGLMLAEDRAAELARASRWGRPRHDIISLRD
jgi:hypothetical protein